MTTPVNFEIAKLLKDKGYDHPSRRYYEYALTESYNEQDGYSGSFGWRKGETNLQEGYFVNNSHGDHSSDAWYMCTAPTIAEVVMWLYEKHGIWIEIKSPDTKSMGWYFSLHKPHSFGNHYNGEEIHYNSPTEAYEAAIEYTLKNLITGTV